MTMATKIVAVIVLKIRCQYERWREKGKGKLMRYTGNPLPHPHPLSLPPSLLFLMSLKFEQQGLYFCSYLCGYPLDYMFIFPW
ncbi:hypothetical protein RJT34_17244 [Clitoria ternatea]|uniref:Uncharacterized protein n=1 Tax=Clitoria ternatea TaxID=43366 RepID=A0AAN9J8L4_CLITE